MTNNIDPRLTMRVGNIVNQPDCDAIVNSANPNLRLGSGVSGAVHGAAGPELEAYCVQFRPLGLAQVILTPGFKLPQNIIHVRAPKFEDDPEPEKMLEQAVQNVLALAEHSGCKKIAMPALATGVYRFPMGMAANIMVLAIASHLASVASKLLEIRIVLATQEALIIFERAEALRIQLDDARKEV